VKILLFGGFLGSGKTTIILQIAKQITEVRAETVVIIENEIGETGVDDQLLRGSGLQVRPLFGGCVCCQITGDLILSIQEISEALNPEWLIVEMTGLAIPGKTAELIAEYVVDRSLMKTMTIVDGGRWPELKCIVEPLIVGQIEKSDLVIVNKADIAGSDQDETIADIQQQAGSIPLLVVAAIHELPPAVFEEVFRFG